MSLAGSGPKGRPTRHVPVMNSRQYTSSFRQKLRGMSRSLLNYFGRTLPNECYAALVTWATGLIVIRSW
jgi:hypothetical protein